MRKSDVRGGKMKSKNRNILMIVGSALKVGKFPYELQTEVKLTRSDVKQIKETGKLRYIVEEEIIISTYDIKKEKRK